MIDIHILIWDMTEYKKIEKRYLKILSDNNKIFEKYRKFALLWHKNL
jgi:hypothetical protein